MAPILAIDQGTTATKAMLVSPEGETVGFASVPVKRSYPRPGWVEQDPVELWESVLGAVEQLPSGKVAAIGVSSQRESVLVWDRRTGRPLAPCISWQCNRGADVCATLRALGAEGRVRELTGLPLQPMFSAPKLRHLLDANPELRKAAIAGEACAGTMDSWLAWNLTGGGLHVIDAGNASRTSLFDLQQLSWSEELVELFDIPITALPEVVASSGVVGESMPQGAIPRAPLASLVADSHAALFGLGCLEPGMAKATYGTGTSLASPTGSVLARSTNGLATSVAWLLEAPTYALEGNVFSSGATVEWVANLLGLPDAPAVEELARSVPSPGGAHIVPGFAGLGAPYWRPAARGHVTGLTFGTGAAELALAAIESIAFQVADLVGAVEKDTDEPLLELHADGGATENGLLMQLQADLLGCPVVASSTQDASALGAAFLAGMATGVFSSTGQVAALGRRGATVEPTMSPDHRQEMLAAWREAVAQVLGAR